MPTLCGDNQSKVQATAAPSTLPPSGTEIQSRGSSCQFAVRTQRTIVWTRVPLASVSERFLYTYLEVVAANECRRQLEDLEKSAAAEAAEAAFEVDGEDNEEEEEADGETAKTRKEKREERKRRLKERADRAAERVKELKVAAAGRHGKLRSLLFCMTRCLFHSSLINLQQLDTIKRTLQVQAQLALASASGSINDGIPKMRVEDVLLKLQDVGASRAQGLNRDVGRTWAVGGDSMLDKRAMYEQKTLNELRQMVRQLDLPMPTVWLQMPFRGTIEKESMVLETSPPPTEKSKDAATVPEVAAPAAEAVNDPMTMGAAASDAPSGGGGVEGRLIADHAVNHIEDGATGFGLPKSLTQLIQPEDVLRIGGHGDDLEVVVTSVQEDDEDVKGKGKARAVTHEKKQGNMKGTVYLDKPWASESRTMCSVFRRSEAVRKKPYVDLLLTRENEQKGLSDQIHEAGFSALYSILQGKDVSCPICLCTLESPTITSCGHAFCRACIITMLEQAEHSLGMVQARCAICRKGVTRQQLMQLDTDSIEDFNEHEANTSASAQANNRFVAPGGGDGAASSSSTGNGGGSSVTPCKARKPPSAASSSSAVSPSPTPKRATRGRRRAAVNISADDNGKAPATEAWHHDIADVGFPPAATDETLSEMPTPLNIPRDHRLPSLEPAFLSHLANTRNVMSSKMRTLLADMDRTLEADSTSKFIVFSQFTNVIELVGSVLKDRGINSVEVTGHAQKQARQRAVTAFNNDPTCKAFLVTMGAGAAGLTLTAANTVYVLEPTHSLADEAQALSRAHRIGQTRPVRCVIFFCPGTFEERMLATRLMHHKGDKAALIRKLESADALAVVRTTGVDSNNGSATHFSLEQLAVLSGVQQPPERMDVA